MTAISDRDILRKIGQLDPTLFENLTLDILRACGFRNIVWRTPGSDGGRDIQAEEIFTDLSGTDTRYLWYIECKRYSSSIDWPTLWKKIAYADSQTADYLLLVTNSQPSPNCETEIRRWNEARRRPGLRVWRGYELPGYLHQHQDIGVAHGIIEGDSKDLAVSIEIIATLSKLAQSAYGAWAFDLSPELPLTSASTLSELFHHRMHTLTTYGRFIGGDKLKHLKDWPWLTVEGDISELEEVSFKTIVSTVRHLLQAEKLFCTVHEKHVSLTTTYAKRAFDVGSMDFLDPILFLSMCDDFKIEGERAVKFMLRGING